MKSHPTHPTKRLRHAAAIAAAAALVLAACGGDDDSSSTTAAAAATADSMTDESMTDESMDDESMDDESMDDEGHDDEMTADSMTDKTMEDESMHDGAESSPDFSAIFASATPVEGSFDPASLSGKDSVIWFWAPWCTTCRGEAPGVAEVQAQFGDQVEFVGVPGLGSIDEMKTFISDTGVGGFPQVADETGTVWTDFGVTSMPAFAFINADGTTELVPSALGADELTNKVESLIAS